MGESFVSNIFTPFYAVALVSRGPPLLCIVFRNVGPLQGLPQLFFGHVTSAPKEAELRAYNPQTDIRPGDLVAVAMNDADAQVWGRAFDIAFVDKVLEGGYVGVTYYVCEGVKARAAPTEEEQINSVWVRGRTRPGGFEATIPVDTILCATWVDPPRKGCIYPPEKAKLRAESERLRRGH